MLSSCACATLTRVPCQAYAHNAKIADALRTLAERKGVTPAQLSIAWVGALGPHVVPLPGSSCVSHEGSFVVTDVRVAGTRTVENTQAAAVSLTVAEVKEIQDVVEAIGVRGDRYYGPQTPHLWG
jgi:pyridoxine 4-dehydrogenase